MTFVYLVTGVVQKRGSSTRSPSFATTDLGDLRRFLRQYADDPGNEEAIDIGSSVVFRLQLGAQYFANAPLTARQVLNGEVWPE